MSGTFDPRIIKKKENAFMYRIYDLKCNDIKEPCGFSEKRPTFSWKMESDENDVFQSCYRIKVFKEDTLVWNSGLVQSGEVFGIEYDGEALESGQKYTWTVSSVNNYREEAAGEAGFVTGIMEEDFWSAKWIEATCDRRPLTDTTRVDLVFSGQVKSSPYPEEYLNSPVYMRREFHIGKAVKRAVAFASAHGIYDLQLDGRSVGNMFAPEYTAYGKHLEYQTMDVTEAMGEGWHALGCILADGWYTGKIGLLGVGNQYGETNAFIMQLLIEYQDGSREMLVTDDSFKWSFGPYIYADLFVGEYVDSRKGLKGFSLAGFDDSAWQPVKEAGYGYENLKGQSVAPVQIIREIQPRLIRTPKGEWVLDAGENIAGYTRFCLAADPGTEIGLEHSEVLDKEGNFLQNIMGQNKNQKDRYICSEGENIYRPKFTFHGFRYVKVTGLDNVAPEDFTVCVVGSDLERSGEFITSDEMVNRLQENIYRSQEGNMLSIPTDCPQREKAGWTGDMQIYAATAAFNMDVNAFLRRWLYDMRLEQLPDGQIPNVIPDIDSNKYMNNGDGDHVSSSGWGDACIIVPYRLYRAYGDIKVLKDNFDMMNRWMSYLESIADEEGILGRGEFHFGDWLYPSLMKTAHNPIETSINTKVEISTGMYARMCTLMEEICTALDEPALCEKYHSIYEKIKAAFQREFTDGQGRMNRPLQGIYVMALAAGLVPEDCRETCAAELERLIHENGDCLDTGFLTVPFLLDALWKNGREALAYTLLFQTKPPSWMYEVKMGATTVWENWESILPDGTRTDSSYNHFSFGCVGDFMYRRIGGLNISEAGMKNVRIEPDFGCGLAWAELKHDSPYGLIHIYWQREDGGYRLDVQLPPGIRGTVALGGNEINIGNGKMSFEMEMRQQKCMITTSL